MKVKLLATEGKGYFEEVEWTVPIYNDDQIRVKAVMTGICRSDVDMMQGKFGPLPLNMQGHEGLAQVVSVGANITDCKEGDYVATRGEPAYADYYNADKGTYVVVPAADPKFILEPIACGVNCITQPLSAIKNKEGGRFAIIGSGFLAWVAYCTIDMLKLKFDLDVIGHSNRDLWDSAGIELKDKLDGQYDIILDLKYGTEVFNEDVTKPGALVILAAQRSVLTDFSKLLWNACSMVFPSPRHHTFINSMEVARDLVQEPKYSIDKFWSKCYNRETEWYKAFSDSLNRTVNFNRAYIYWEK